MNPLYDGDDEDYYVILSNYRILYNSSSFSSCHEIKLYQISLVKVEIKKDQIMIKLLLSVGNTTKICLCSYTVNEYPLNFTYEEMARQFLMKLKDVCKEQNLNIEFDEP